MIIIIIVHLIMIWSSCFAKESDKLEIYLYDEITVDIVVSHDGVL